MPRTHTWYEGRVVEVVVHTALVRSLLEAGYFVHVLQIKMWENQPLIRSKVES